MLLGTEAVLNDLSTYGTFVDDNRVDGSTTLQLGQAIRVGTWKLYPWGVEYSIQATNGYVYLFQASVHLNPFGKQPKLSHGTVLREQSLDGGGIRDEEMDEPYLHIYLSL